MILTSSVMIYSYCQG